MVDRVMTLLSDAELEEQRRVSGPGHPRPGLWPVRRCAPAVVTEEWRHATTPSATSRSSCRK